MESRKKGWQISRGKCLCMRFSSRKNWLADGISALRSKSCIEDKQHKTGKERTTTQDTACWSHKDGSYQQLWPEKASVGTDHTNRSTSPNTGKPQITCGSNHGWSENLAIEVFGEGVESCVFWIGSWSQRSVSDK